MRRAFRLELTRSEHAPICATRFGGFPYRESQTWPHCRDCKLPLSFLGQFDPRPALDFDPGFALAALYFCGRCRPRASALNGRGFAIQTFDTPSPDRHVALDAEEHALLSLFEEEGPLDVYRASVVETDELRSFPHWEDWGEWGLEGLEELGPRDRSELGAWLDRLGDTRFGHARHGRMLFTYLGGYPYWVNGNFDYRDVGGSRCRCGSRTVQLLQLDTEEEPGFYFGKGCGLLNVFLCPAARDPAVHDREHDDAVRLVQQFI